MSEPFPPWLRDGRFKVNDISSVALAIVPMGGDAYHTGILHRDFIANKLYFLHLAHHNQFRNEDVTSGINCHFVLPSLPYLIARALAGFCRNIAIEYRKGEMPYGFFYPESPIWSDKGRLIIDGLSNGLTCSHFALSVFEFKRIKLIKRDEWPERPSDVANQMKFIFNMFDHTFQKTLKKMEGSVLALDPQSLRDYIVEQAGLMTHIQKLTHEIGSIRYSPLEVVAAASSNKLPATFEYCVSTAAEIHAALTKPTLLA